MEITPANIDNMQTMLQNPMSVFDRLKELGFRKNFKELPTNKEEAISTFKEFTGSIKEFLNNEVFGAGAGNLDINSENIRHISKLYSHMDFLDRQSDEENYEIPTTIGSQDVAINLKIIHTGSAEQRVAVSFASAVYGNVAAQFKAGPDGLSGYCSLENPEMSEVLNNALQGLKDDLSDKGMKLNDMYFVNNSNTDLYQFNIKQSKDRTTDTDVVTEDNLYKAARSFIEFMDRMAAERI